MIFNFQVAKYFYNSPSNQRELEKTIHKYAPKDEEDNADSDSEVTDEAGDEHSRESETTETCDEQARASEASEEGDEQARTSEATEEGDVQVTETQSEADEVEKRLTNGPTRKKLKLLCRTRWVERHVAFEDHLILFPYV